MLSGPKSCRRGAKSPSLQTRLVGRSDSVRSAKCRSSSSLATWRLGLKAGQNAPKGDRKAFLRGESALNHAELHQFTLGPTSLRPLSRLHSVEAKAERLGKAQSKSRIITAEVKFNRAACWIGPRVYQVNGRCMPKA